MKEFGSDKIEFKKLHYIGEGTYGIIYQIPESTHVIKIHDEYEKEGHQVVKCEDWKKEYNIHRYIVKKCRKLLGKYKIDIPNVYDYQTTKMVPGGLQKVIRRRDADSCYYTMDRIPNRTGSDKTYDALLGQIVKSIEEVGIDSRPPYLYLGSIVPIAPAITLDMVHGVRLQNTLGERFNFAHVESESVAYNYQKNMVGGFFTLAGCGFVPRDIEYALAIHSSEGSIKTMIYDFNQCDFVEERLKKAFSTDTYNYSKDLAEIYIDLCGLRHENDKLGNRLVLDTPTPNWKFLCNPLVSPGSWCEIMDWVLKEKWDGGIDIQVFIKYVLDYLKGFYYGKEKGAWKSRSAYFYKGRVKLLQECDTIIQEIFVYPIWIQCLTGKKCIGGWCGDFLEVYTRGCVMANTYIPYDNSESDSDWDIEKVVVQSKRTVSGGTRRNTRKKRKGVYEA